MRRASLAFLLLSACTAARLANRVPEGPLPETTEETSTYDIEGSTASQLRASLDRLGPVIDGARYDARSIWKVNWSYKFERGQGGCSLKNVSTTVKVTFILPRWPGENPEVGPHWQRYLSALLTHEKGHARIGIDAARFIVSALQALPPGRDCEVADSLAAAAAREELELARDWERDYDAQTRHGATQGATFP
jgi:predicted secreted Zn-dependent protease